MAFGQHRHADDGMCLHRAVLAPENLLCSPDPSLDVANVSKLDDPVSQFAQVLDAAVRRNLLETLAHPFLHPIEGHLVGAGNLITSIETNECQRQGVRGTSCSIHFLSNDLAL